MSLYFPHQHQMAGTGLWVNIIKTFATECYRSMIARNPTGVFLHNSNACEGLVALYQNLAKNCAHWNWAVTSSVSNFHMVCIPPDPWGEQRTNRRGLSPASSPLWPHAHAMDSSNLRPCHPSMPVNCLDPSSLDASQLRPPCPSSTVDFIFPLPFRPSTFRTTIPLWDTDTSACTLPR